MKCHSCGEEIRDTARFCGFCGAEQIAPPAEEMPAVEERGLPELEPVTEVVAAEVAVAEEAPLTQIPELEVEPKMEEESVAPVEAEPEIVPAPVIEDVQVPAAEPVEEPVAAVEEEPTPAPVAVPVVDPTPAPVAEPVREPAPAPVVVPVVEPAPQPAPQPVPQPVVVPAPQPAPQPVYQAPPQPQYQAPQPQYQQPQYQPAPRPVYQQPAQPQYQPRPAYTQQPVQTKPAPARGGYAPARKLPTRRGLGKMFWLGIVTLGIYPSVIMSRIPEEMNIVASRYDGKRTEQMLWMPVLATLTLGIYALVWIHQLCNRMGAELQRRRIDYKFGASTFWLWNVLGSLILVGPFIYTHKMMKAMNLINSDYNEKG